MLPFLYHLKVAFWHTCDPIMWPYHVIITWDSLHSSFDLCPLCTMEHYMLIEEVCNWHHENGCGSSKNSQWMEAQGTCSRSYQASRSCPTVRGLWPGTTTSIVLFQSSKSEVDLGGTDRKVEWGSWEDKWNLDGMGIKTVMWWQEDEARTRRDIQTKVLVLQSPGLYSTIERQCLKTKRVVLGESTCPSDGEVQDPGEWMGAVPKDPSGVNTGSLRASLVHVRLSEWQDNEMSESKWGSP